VCWLQCAKLIKSHAQILSKNLFFFRRLFSSPGTHHPGVLSSPDSKRLVRITAVFRVNRFTRGIFAGLRNRDESLPDCLSGSVVFFGQFGKVRVRFALEHLAQKRRIDGRLKPGTDQSVGKFTTAFARVRIGKTPETALDELAGAFGLPFRIRGVRLLERVLDEVVGNAQLPQLRGNSTRSIRSGLELVGDKNLGKPRVVEVAFFFVIGNDLLNSRGSYLRSVRR
jgi:hypothetical protein